MNTFFSFVLGKLVSKTPSTTVWRVFWIAIFVGFSGLLTYGKLGR